ncbi:MAG: nitrogenase [Butyrivibrio sp.]|uniref:nitrogenase component 1 n=1 Tax=Butyrivibrio sp. TaxID=28121 RepID=UPI0025C18187|nr:nitrogenase component 1 [Butyrivibrio sp.]MBQ6589250.1 nitrogenase [Butyrivibrio sp.]
MSNSLTTEVEVRERRLKSIISFAGKASELQAGAVSQKKVEQPRCFSQCSDCAQMRAGTICSHIRDAAVVVHSPMGCFANNPANDEINKSGSLGRGQKPFKTNVVCSNISEKETIYGGLKKLREAIDEAYKRFHPSAIFVQSSCAAGIVGDDIESVADEKQAEYGIPVVPVYCEGFKSKVWSSGFDAGYHALLKRIVKEPEKKQPDLVNIFNFMGSDTFSEILGKIGLRPNYLVPLADIDTIARMTEAACSTSICETLGTYITDVLEKQYGVPHVHATAPYGIKWTDAWYREVARLTGKSDIVEEVIAKEHERIAPKLEELRKELKGLRIYIYAGDSYAHNMASIASDLGIEIAGITTLHHDMKTDGEPVEHSSLQEMINVAGDIEHFSVCEKQPYEVIKILKQVKPDVVIIRHMHLPALSAKLGIPSILEGEVNVSAGYDGIITLGERLKNIRKFKRVLTTLEEYNEFPYTKQWLEDERLFI